MSSLYGAHGRTLLLELANSRPDPNQPGSGATIPAYNTDAVAAALQDLRLHVQALQDQVQAASGSDKPPLQVRPSLLLQQAAIQRYKRCLLTYHVERWKRLRTQATSGAADDPLLANCSPAEQELLQQYRRGVQRYFAKALGDETTTSTQPELLQLLLPVMDRVLIRILEDNRQSKEDAIEEKEPTIVLESGATMQWIPGTTHYLLLSDVQDYIRSGKVALLSGEEEE